MNYRVASPGLRFHSDVLLNITTPLNASLHESLLNRYSLGKTRETMFSLYSESGDDRCTSYPRKIISDELSPGY